MLCQYGYGSSLFCCLYPIFHIEVKLISMVCYHMLLFRFLMISSDRPVQVIVYVPPWSTKGVEGGVIIAFIVDINVGD